MRELSLSRRSRSRCVRFPLLLAVAAIILIPGRAVAIEAEVTKVLVAEGDVREITNVGTVQAVNAIFGSDDMPADAKVHAVSSVLKGEASRGWLQTAALFPGDAETGKKNGAPSW